MRTSAYAVWLCVFQLLTGTAWGVKWLSMAMSSINAVTHENHCEKIPGLVGRQKKICRRNVDLIPSVKEGARLSITECQYQFVNRRWNCSTVDTRSIFGNVLNQGTREAAFVHAISSAGVSHSVTRACSSGKLERCGCDRTKRGKSPDGFEWSGCSDNIAFGTAFSQRFVDARERTKGKRIDRALMNLHNNQAGRLAVETQMSVQCKCHGVSGSCELKTCWRAMPSFRKVGLRLKEKFDGATEVQQQRIGMRKELVPTNDQFKPHTDSDLVYLVASPDFCDADKKTGSLGTHGRLCNKTSKAIDGCDLMCCGRGYKSRTKIVIDRCNCKFYWCCHVKCKKCRTEVEENTCL